MPTLRVAGYAAKQLLLVPHRVALALQADGWIVRNDIVVAKRSPMTEKVDDRCTRAHDYLFLLSKASRYYWNQEAIRAPPTTGPKGANASDVWWVNRHDYVGEHYAVMPLELAERCIQAGSRQGDTILDPFGGVGTTGLAAQKLGRKAVLIELNARYVAMARERLGLPQHTPNIRRADRKLVPA